MSGIPGLIGPPPGKILSQLHTCPPGYIFLSQQLQSKSRKAVLLHGKIVFIALENYSMFGLSDDVQKIRRDTGIEMSDNTSIYKRHYLSLQLFGFTTQ